MTFLNAAACQEKDSCKYRNYCGQVSHKIVSFHRLDLLIILHPLFLFAQVCFDIYSIEHYVSGKADSKKAPPRTPLNIHSGSQPCVSQGMGYAFTFLPDAASKWYATIPRSTFVNVPSPLTFTDGSSFSSMKQNFC